MKMKDENDNALSIYETREECAKAITKMEHAFDLAKEAFGLDNAMTQEIAKLLSQLRERKLTLDCYAACLN